MIFDRPVTSHDVVAIARQHEPVEIPAAVLRALRRAAAESRALSHRIPTYGRGTGVGANKTAAIGAADDEHGLRLLRSSALDAGPYLPARAVRAMLAVRLAQLCVPGSGLAPEIVERLADMLNADALPEIRQFGSIGTGDLTALAGVALALMGERPTALPLEPMAPWSNDSALPFISSNALTLGRAALAARELAGLLDAAMVVFGLTFTGLRGNPSPFSEAAARASASPVAVRVAERMRTVLGDARPPARIQDAYGLRVFLSTLAPAVEAVEQVVELVDRAINTAQENPLFVFEADGTGTDVVHHGGFHQAALGLKVDAAKLALAAGTPLALSRIRMMTEPADTGLRPFLAVGPEGASGIMMLEYVVAAAHGTLHQAAQPSSLIGVTLSRGVEEDASFASHAVQQLEEAVAAYRVVLAGELVAATRLLRQQGLRPEDMPGPVLAEAFAEALLLPQDDEDRDQRPDLEQADRLLEVLAGTLSAEQPRELAAAGMEAR